MAIPSLHASVIQDLGSSGKYILGNRRILCQYKKCCKLKHIFCYYTEVATQQEPRQQKSTNKGQKFLCLMLDLLDVKSIAVQLSVAQCENWSQ